MILERKNLAAIRNNPAVQVAGDEVFNLPEKVLQFGTGVLLRGLPDYFIDKANRQGVFNGRVVVVKSTSQGDTNAFAKQDNLYTVCIKGVENGALVEEDIVITAISRVLSAQEQWNDILACAAKPAMQIVISNTTEVGISLVKENVLDGVPASFPGKLLAFLYKRYHTLGNNVESGMVIVPTELISDNGTKLKSIILELAAFNQFDEAFINWLDQHNDFCNSLVDRIVPGRLPAATEQKSEQLLGYKDELKIMSECYALWAIETSSARTKEILSFAGVHKGVILTPDITKYKEIKLRLLNGTHTFSCGLAMLAGFRIVKDAMSDKTFELFLTNLMQEEIANAIIDNHIDKQDCQTFAHQVIDRFKNPHLDHQWLSITMQYTSKMAMRNVPLIRAYYEKHNSVPQFMALGFAGYLLFMRTEKNSDGKYQRTINQQVNLVTDDKAEVLYALWQQYSGDDLAQQALAKKELWGTDLSALPGFVKAVSNYVELLEKKPVEEVIGEVSSEEFVK